MATVALFMFYIRALPGFPLWLASRGNRLRTATQERKGALCIFHALTLFMMIAVVLQIPQTSLNRRFRHGYALNQLLRIQLHNGSGA